MLHETSESETESIISVLQGISDMELSNILQSYKLPPTLKKGS